MYLVTKYKKNLTIDVRPVFEKGFPISNCISFKLIGAKTAVKLQLRFVPTFDNVNRLLSSVTKTLHAEMERYSCKKITTTQIQISRQN